MANIKFRRGRSFGTQMAGYIRELEDMDGDTDGHSKLLDNLVRCIREDVTPRQREVLLLYYFRGMRQIDIAQQLGVARSTVSRTIQRGERRLKRCLRYGAERYLRATEENEQEGSK